MHAYVYNIVYRQTLKKRLSVGRDCKKRWSTIGVIRNYGYERDLDRDAENLNHVGDDERELRWRNHDVWRNRDVSLAERGDFSLSHSKKFDKRPIGSACHIIADETSEIELV